MSSADGRSNLERLLAEGQFVVCGEMSPPKGADKEPLLKKIRHFKGFVDAVNITDNQSASVRMSSGICCMLIHQEGLEPIQQFTCRDRNRLALQSEMLAAYAMGIRNVLCLEGDHPKFGDHPEARGVWDLDSTQLVQLAATMSGGKFMSGEPIEPPPRFFVGAAAHPFGEPFEMRVWSVAKKIEAGARYFQTQPVFDIPKFEVWMKAIRDEGLDKKAAIIPGVMPVRSPKALHYMMDNVPGMRVSREVAERIDHAADPSEEGIEMCVETIRRLREIPGVAGVHIMPVMKESILPRIVEEAGLLPRPSPAWDAVEIESGGERQ